MKKSFFAIGIAAIVLAGCTEVPTGNRGVEVNFGEVKGTHTEGLVGYNPITTDIILMNVQQRKWEEKTQAYTKDVQQAQIEFALTYSLNPANVEKVYSEVGTEWASVLVPQVVEQSIKDVIGRSRAVEDTINNRPKIQSEILTDLKKRLAERSVIVHGFEIQDISFSDAFEKAVENKQVAVENANTAKNKTVEIQEKAKQQVIAAEAEAEAMRIKTAALAGSPKLVEYEAVQKWDGVLPQNMYGSAPLPMITAGR